MELLLFFISFAIFIIPVLIIYYFKKIKIDDAYYPKSLKRRLSKNADGEDFLKEISKRAGLFIIKNKAKGSYEDIDITFDYNYTGNENIYTLTINPHGHEKTNLSRVYIEDERLDILVDIKTYLGNFRNVIFAFTNKTRNTLRKINKYFDIIVFDKKIIIQTKDNIIFLDQNVLKDLIYISKKLLDKNTDTDQQLINIVLNDNNKKVRRNCMKELVKYVDLNKNRDSIKLIMNEMKEKDPLISIMASSILEEEGISHCIEIFLNNKDSEVIFYAIKILKKYIHLDRILNAFHKALYLLNDNYIPDIIKVIYKIKTKNNIKFLMDFLKQNNYLSIYLKITCIDFFKINKIIESKDWILSQIYNYDLNVAGAALNALKIIGDVECIEKLDKFIKSYNNKILKKLTNDTIKYIQKNIPKHLEGNLQITDHNQHGDLSIYNEKGELSIEVITQPSKKGATRDSD